MIHNTEDTPPPEDDGLTIQHHFDGMLNGLLLMEVTIAAGQTIDTLPRELRLALMLSGTIIGGLLATDHGVRMTFGIISNILQRDSLDQDQ